MYVCIMYVCIYYGISNYITFLANIIPKFLVLCIVAYQY